MGEATREAGLFGVIWVPDFRTRRGDQETAAREALLGCAQAHCAFIEDTADGICTLDLRVAGVSHDGAVAMGDRVLGQLGGMGFRARFGLGPTPELALCAARMATVERPVVAFDDAGGEIEELPLEALSPDPVSAGLLRAWGVRTIGEFISLGREALAERLGAAGARLWDRAAGRAPRPLRLVRAREVFSESCELEFELAELEPVQFRLRRMLEHVIRHLGASHRVAGALRLELGFSDGACHRADLPVPEPTLNEAALFGLLQNHLDRLRAPAGVVAIRLSAEPADAAARQPGIFDAGLRAPARYAETVARIAGWVGPQRIGYAVLRDSHRPDDFSLDPPGPPPGHNPGEARGTQEARPPAGLALRRFRPPRPVGVQMEGGMPIFVGVRPGGAGRVVGARGPWPLSGHWWDAGAWEREEWDVEIEGAGLWRIFRDGGCWFLDGVYD